MRESHPLGPEGTGFTDPCVYFSTLISRAGTLDETRTHTIMGLNHSPPANWATRVCVACFLRRDAHAKRTHELCVCPPSGRLNVN